jgi:hypothetical protein
MRCAALIGQRQQLFGLRLHCLLPAIMPRRDSLRPCKTKWHGQRETQHKVLDLIAHT